MTRQKTAVPRESHGVREVTWGLRESRAGQGTQPPAEGGSGKRSGTQAADSRRDSGPGLPVVSVLICAGSTEMRGQAIGPHGHSGSPSQGVHPGTPVTRSCFLPHSTLGRTWRLRVLAELKGLLGFL